MRIRDLNIIRYCVSGNTFFICIFVTAFSVKFDLILFSLFTTAWIVAEVLEYRELKMKIKEED